MIVKELYGTGEDGVLLVKTYSDIGMMIERDGDLYSEAIDPDYLDRTYVETDIPAEDDLTAEEALAIITGGEV